MFKITSTQAINWAPFEFALVTGDNIFPSRKSVPAELWPKLERFRALEVLDFEGDAHAKDDKGPVLAELTEQQLFAMSKADLAELAKASGVVVAAAAGVAEPSKSLLLAALVPLGAPPVKLDDEPKTEGDKAAPVAAAAAGSKASGKGGGKSGSAQPSDP